VSAVISGSTSEPGDSVERNREFPQQLANGYNTLGNVAIRTRPLGQMRLSRAELRQRYDELRALVNEWDPVGVMDDPSWPRDEYDCLVGPILRHLDNGASIGTITTFLNEVLAGHFGQPVPVERAEGWAREAREWYARRWPGSGSVPQADAV
jgi:hypothetical protein